MMGLCPLHNAFYMLTLYADAHLQQFLINCSGFPPDYIKLTFLVKPRLVILFQKSITVLHISVNVHIFFDNFLVFFSTILRGTMIWCPPAPCISAGNLLLHEGSPTPCFHMDDLS